MKENTKAFSLAGRVKSIQHALSGITEMLRGQPNAWIHLFATLCVALTAYLFKVSASEWCFLVLAITAVWVSEALNTALEFLCDAASPDFHPLVKKSKDVAAGAVLLSAICASIVGLIIFTPYVAAHL
ncbi:diacylglycerol kinase family protein [Crenobacter cavernae]|uniref:Diacylglycerol kinase family protein n=1 Tax=Crenobacter cavernae TaxID=2290923 RepID=A0ABY0FHN5_9NEIS|nr:diacylglycerol kinase family protein [Crenobacter cavernae]RXZ45043.1 diacylglycerol kinase family protein [Crenobacter cavernae]